MLVGTGAIAHRFSDFALRSDYFVYAGAVHDSLVVDDAVFQEDRRVLIESLEKAAGRYFVYFSSCSVAQEGNVCSPYVQHKREMELVVREYASRYIIVRLPQFVGLHCEDSNLLNFLVDSVRLQTPFKLWANSFRNIIDIDDVYELVSEVLRDDSFVNSTVTVASPRQTSVEEIVRRIEAFFEVSALS